MRTYVIKQIIFVISKTSERSIAHSIALFANFRVSMTTRIFSRFYIENTTKTILHGQVSGLQMNYNVKRY